MMAAQSIELYVIILPNPEWSAPSSKPERASPSISYALLLQKHVLSLSTTTTEGIKDIKGFLYVPDLDPSDPCVRLSSPYIPNNVTRQANLPHTDYDLIAVAPWVSPDCTLAFFAAARQDPIRAFIFYPTDDGVAQLPPATDAMWSLNDGGQWRSHNKFPVYAVPGAYGKEIMVEMSRYSGNMTDVENGAALVEMYNSRDYARMFGRIETLKKNTLPSLWIFLVIVVAMLLVIIFTISFLTRCIQHKRRQALRRRVANGEVDLEALGIKRLTVPRALVEQMPLFVYIAAEGEQSEGAPKGTPPLPADNWPQASQLPQSQRPSMHLARPPEAVIASSSSPRSPSTSPTGVALTTSHRSYRLPPSPSLPRRSLPYSQLSCPICLEDFVPSLSTVRELPCGHDFHPECVDTFLQERSSLCPMCKKSVLPRGYCPEDLSNAVVRRERIMRRMRERVVVEVVGTTEDGELPRRGRRRQRIGSFHHHFGRAARSSGGNATISPGLEMRATGSSQAPGEGSVRPENHDVTSRTRRRPINLLRRQPATEDGEAENGGTRPGWRKVVDAVFARR